MKIACRHTVLAFATRTTPIQRAPRVIGKQPPKIWVPIRPTTSSREIKDKSRIRIYVPLNATRHTGSEPCHDICRTSGRSNLFKAEAPTKWCHRWYRLCCCSHHCSVNWDLRHCAHRSALFLEHQPSKLEDKVSGGSKISTGDRSNNSISSSV